MKDQPLITVIVPVYNTADYLRQCLDSACAQTHKNLEIICVDDGSTDNSLALLHEYEQKDKRITVLTANHGGAAAARNRALDIAHGEWVIGLDSDDWLEPDAYERALANAQEDVDIIFFSAVNECEEEGPHWEKVLAGYDKYYRHPYTGKVPSSPDLIAHTIVSPCLALRRRSLIEKYHLRYMEGHIYEDEDFHFHFMAHVSHAMFCHDKLYHRRLHASSVMQKPDKERLEDLVPLFAERIYRHYVQTGVLDSCWEALHILLLERGYRCIERRGDAVLIEQWRSRILDMARCCGMIQAPRFRGTFAEILGVEKYRFFSVRIFGLLPLFKVCESPNRYRLNLFDVLPLWVVRRKPHKDSYWLFGALPLLSIKKGERFKPFILS